MKMWKVGMLAFATMLSSCVFTCDQAFVDNYNKFRRDMFTAITSDSESELNEALDFVADYRAEYGGEVCLLEIDGETVEVDATETANQFEDAVNEALDDL